MDTRATITIERTSGQITGRVAEGFVLVREDGTLCDQINDADADLGDVYGAIELAISGETLGPRGLEGEVEADGETYRWTVRRPAESRDDRIPVGTRRLSGTDWPVYVARDGRRVYLLCNGMAGIVVQVSTIDGAREYAEDLARVERSGGALRLVRDEQDEDGDLTAWHVETVEVGDYPQE